MRGKSKSSADKQLHLFSRAMPVAKNLLLLPLAALLSGGVPQSDWQPIFDGRTLNGWTPKISGHAVGEDPLSMFIVHDGAIRVSHANYPRFDGEFGHLFWKEPLEAYRLRFEYRLFGETLPGVKVWQHTNSGVMFHAQAPDTMRRDQAFPVSLEMQLLAVPRPVQEPSGNVCTTGTTVEVNGKRDPRHCILSSSPLLPSGTWSRAEIEVTSSGDITHLINGKVVLRYKNPQLDPDDADARVLIAAADGALKLHSGYIALQSEGHPVEFRNIELKLLD